MVLSSRGFVVSGSGASSGLKGWPSSSHFDPNLCRLHAKAHLNFVFSVVRVTIRDDVGENLFQGEIEIVHNLGGQTMPLAEFRQCPINSLDL